MSEKIEYIAPAQITFYNNESGLIMANFQGNDMGRVAVLRMFPFDYDEKYLSVRCERYSREDKESEIGIIKDLSEFDALQSQIVRDELLKRYFIPDILKVYEVKEEFGNTMWKTKTSAGEREFTVTDMNANVLNLGNNKIMLTDIYANRYYIPDITKMDDKTIKILEIWIG